MATADERRGLEMGLSGDFPLLWLIEGMGRGGRLWSLWGWGLGNGAPDDDLFRCFDCDD